MADAFTLYNACVRLAEHAMFASVTVDNVFTLVPELEYRSSKAWVDLKAAARIPLWSQGKTEREIAAIATRFTKVLKLRKKP